MSKSKNAPFNFESALSELEQLITKLESGDLNLENSLQEFERGITLTRQCQTALQEAEQKVSLMTQDGEETDLPPLDEA